jgi:hypothetical protein
MTDENQTLVMDLGYRLGYLSVIASGLFLNRGSHSTATIIPRDIHLHKTFLVYTSTTVQTVQIPAPHLAGCNIIGHMPGVDPQYLLYMSVYSEV